MFIHPIFKKDIEELKTIMFNRIEKHQKCIIKHLFISFPSAINFI